MRRGNCCYEIHYPLLAPSFHITGLLVDFTYQPTSSTTGEAGANLASSQGPPSTPSSSSTYAHMLNLGNKKTDSIFHDPGTGILFASFKYVGFDYAGDMERMRENPKVREWWAMTDGFQEVRRLLITCLFAFSLPPSLHVTPSVLPISMVFEYVVVASAVLLLLYAYTNDVGRCRVLFLVRRIASLAIRPGGRRLKKCSMRRSSRALIAAAV